MKKGYIDDRREEEPHPHLTEFMEFLPAVQKESPRGEVLISVSYLDELLRRILLAFFVNDQRHAQLVDNANAPLGTFSSRINACEALGLIRPREAEELHRMRKIRNRFSHEVHVSFNDQQIGDLCANLAYKAPDYGDVVLTSRAQFGSATSALILHLVNRAARVSFERRQHQDWPY